MDKIETETGIRSYHAEATCQLVQESDPDSWLGALRRHESQMGFPLCGTPARPWHGHKVIVKDLGPGEVNCLRCARSRHAQAA
jgi:hypothetical protein